MSTALQRAVKAIFEASADHGVAPFYVYAEHDGDGGAASFQTRGEAQQAFDTATTFAYAALFDSSDPAWPDPVAQHAPPQTSVAGRGVSGHHGHMASAIEYGSTASTTDTHAGADVRQDPWADTAAPAAPQISDRPPTVNEQTDQMFYDAHPELWNAQIGQYRRLDPKRAQDAALVQEWLVYRDFIVSALREQGADRATQAARQPHLDSPGGAVASASQMISSSGDPTMNSNDPWRAMEGVPPGLRMVVPRQTHASVLGWPHFGKLYGHERRTPNGWGKYRPKRKGMLLDVAPVMHPAQDVEVVLTNLDPQNVLHVAITVDAKHSYRAAVDLNKAIAVVMHKLARWHKREHERMGRRALVGNGPAGAIDAAVGTAATALIGKLLDDHVAAVCSGWLDDIGNAIQSTVRAIKGPLTIAATAVATAIPGVGPFVAPLVPLLVNAAAGSPKAKQQVQQVKAAAAQNPQQQQALNQAQQIVAQHVANAHVAVTAQQAAQGDPSAQAQMQVVQQAAQAGDPAAQKAAQVAQQAAQAAQANPNASPQQLLTQLLGTLGVQPGQQQPAINQGASYAPSPAGAACIDFCAPSCAPSCAPAVQGWFSDIEHAVEHVAKDAAEIGIPGYGAYEVAKDLAGHKHAKHHPKPHHVQFHAKPHEQEHAEHRFQAEFEPRVSGSEIALVGAAIDTLRTEAMHAVHDSDLHGAIGVVHGVKARVPTLVTFYSTDDADDWLARLRGEVFLYAAYFDTTDPTFPEPLNERLGAVVHQTPGAAAAVSGVALLPALFGLGLGAGGMAAWDRRAAIKSWLTGAPAA